jgi:hypothetical protein
MGAKGLGGEMGRGGVWVKVKGGRVAVKRWGEVVGSAQRRRVSGGNGR